MKIIFALLLGIIGLFFVLGQVNQTNFTEEGLHGTVIAQATSRFWDSDLKDELGRLTYEERTLIYEFMEQYHKVYLDYYQGPITFGDAIFHQRLTGNLSVKESEDLSQLETLRKKDELIRSLRTQSEHYQRAYENAIKAQHSNQPLTIPAQPNSSDLTRSYSSPRQESTISAAQNVDKEAVYRDYGVYELEEQLKRSRALDRKDPKWYMFQSDSPHTQEIRRALLEARTAADRSMR